MREGRRERVGKEDRGMRRKEGKSRGRRRRKRIRKRMRRRRRRRRRRREERRKSERKRRKRYIALVTFKKKALGDEGSGFQVIVQKL